MLMNQLKIVAAVVLITARSAWRPASPGPSGRSGQCKPADAKLPAAIAAAGGTAASKKPSPQQVEVRGVVVDEAGRPVAGAEVRADAFTDREAGGVTGADGSFAIPIRRQRVDGTALLARSAGGDRLGIFQYGFNLTRAEAEAPARIVLKPGREVIVRVTDSSKAPVPGAAVEVAGNFARARRRDDRPRRFRQAPRPGRRQGRVDHRAEVGPRVRLRRIRRDRRGRPVAGRSAGRGNTRRRSR